MNFKRSETRRTTALAVIVAVLTGLSADPLIAKQTPESKESLPNVGRWRPFILRSSSEMRLPAPPPAGSAKEKKEIEELRSFQALRNRVVNERVAFWGSKPGYMRWAERQLLLAPKYRLNPVRVSRALAMVHTAMFDAMVAAHDSQDTYRRRSPSQVDRSIRPLLKVEGTGSYPSDDAAIAAAACKVLSFLFPADAGEFAKMEEEACMSRLWAGVNYRSDVEKGRELGHAVADLVIARGKSDGANRSWDGFGRVTSVGYWTQTPPLFGGPAEPLWGRVTPWLMPRGDLFRPGPPPLPGTPEFSAQHLQVKQIVDHLTDQQKQIALYWADGPGSVTPPGHWNVLGNELVAAKKVPAPEALRIMTLVNTAQADAFIACWDAKYAYWSERPVTAIRRLFDPQWKTFIPTPAFPGYISGHATTSGAASDVLAYFFPDKAEWLRGRAEEAAMSRLYAGIHIDLDNKVGLKVGRQIAQLAIQRAQADEAQPGEFSRRFVAAGFRSGAYLANGDVISFPMPATRAKWPTIRAEVADIDGARIHIRDASGQLVREADLSKASWPISNNKDLPPAYEYTWDTSHVEPGVYIYSVDVRTNGAEKLYKMGKLVIAE